MIRPKMTFLGTLIVGLLLAASIGHAQPQQQAMRNTVAGNNAAAAPPVIREILVPIEDIKVLLDASPQRVMLSREEFDELKKLAKQKESATAPVATTMLSAQYTMEIQDGRAIVQGRLEIETLREGLQTLPLPLAGVSLLSAKLNDQPASLGRDNSGTVQLFVDGLGKHQLDLEFVIPVIVSAAQQSLSFKIPAPPSSTMKISVPGNVEIKNGADVVSRAVDADSETTNFEVLVPRAQANITMSLNNRRLRDERAVVARSLIISRVQDSYENVEMSISLGILHGAVQQVRFRVPSDLEITEIQSEWLERWGIEEEGETNSTIAVDLRQAATKPFALNVTGVRNRVIAGDGTQWSFPQLEVLDVDGQVAVVGVAVEPHLRVRDVVAERLIPIDRTVFADRVAGVLAAYYAPASDFALSATIENPAPQLDAMSSFLLTIGRRELTVDGGFLLEPQIRKIFSFDFSAPSQWKIQYVSDASGAPLAFEEYSGVDGTSLYHVRLPKGAVPGTTYQVEIHASHVPDTWLGEWDTQQIVFPVIRVQNADIERGAIAATAIDDLAVRPDTLESLSVLNEQEKQEFGLTTQSDLAYRFDVMPFNGVFTVEPTESQLTARTASFYKITPQGLAAHYELDVAVREATARRITVSLPESTPDEVTIWGIGATTVKEYNAEVVDGRRNWEILLANDVALDLNRVGSMAIGLTFERPLSVDEQDSEPIILPGLQVADVVYQSGTLSVEGHAEFDVAVETDARRVDVGELSSATYQPGRRLLGAFGYAGDLPEVTATITSRDSFRLPTVIVQRAELFTGVGVNGVAQTVARYSLQSKPTTLRVELPEDAKIWSVILDGKPLAPQHEKQQILINIAATDNSNVHDLRLVYESSFSTFRIRGSSTSAMPKLLVANEAGEQAEVPLADVQWQIAAPSGWSVTADRKWTAQQQVEPITVNDVLNAWAERVTPPVQYAFRSVGTQIESTGDSSGPSYYDDQTMEDSFQYGGDYDAGGEDAMMPAETASPPTVQEPAPPGTDAPQDPSSPNDDIDADMPQSSTVLSNEQKSEDSQEGEDDEASVTKYSAAQEAWALQGMRSLPIDWSDDFEELNEVASFQSLGGNNEIRLDMVDRNRIIWIAAAAFFITLLIGFAFTSKSCKVKVRFYALLLFVGFTVPILAGRADWIVVRTAIFVALMLTFGVHFAAWVICRASKQFRLSVGALLLILLSRNALGQTETPDDILNALKDLVATSKVELPEDAVIVPFQAGEGDDLTGAVDQVLVPYGLYTQLRNLAYPLKPVDVKPIVPYGFAGAAYQTNLVDGDHLEMTGELQYELYSDSLTAVPLSMNGGVVIEALVGGKPARMQLVGSMGQNLNSAPNAPNGPAQQGQQQVEQAAPQLQPPVLMLYLAGKGSHKLSLTLRFPLARQGGWRKLEGQLPVASASVFTVTVPGANTDVRFAGIPDRQNHTTTEANQDLRVAMAASGQVSMQFRPQVAEAEVDRSLTANSLAVFDVQEDGLRLAWRIQYEFRQGRRNTLSSTIPEGYLLEKVIGDNVRGWDVQNGRLDVELLKDVTDREVITVFLSRRERILSDAEVSIPMPKVGVPDAMLHTGTISVRRSPRLELSIKEQSQLGRDDGHDELAEQLMRLAGEQASPLTIRPFQTYRFGTADYAATLTAKSIGDRTEAAVESIVRVSPRRTEWEMRVRFDVKDIPLHVVEMDLPAGFEIRTLSQPESVTSQIDGGQRLTIYLTAAESAPFFLVLKGILPPMDENGVVPIPKIAIQNVVRQTGQMVIQVDPAYRVQPANLTGTLVATLDRANSWLTPDQRQLSIGGLVLKMTDANYSGNLSVVRRDPDVRVTTLTNVRVTDQSIEETILLEFRVLEAGIREIQFQLPASLANSRFRVPSLRSKTVTPVEGQLDLVQVRLELQDDLMDEIRVVVENDRLATSDAQLAPIPRIQTGTVEQQYVTLQNEGRDELVVEDSPGLTPLSDSQRRWRSLVDLDITQGYEVNRSANDPLLRFHNEVRETLKTADARIDHSEITLVVDDAGSYRAQHLFYVENSTEPYLEIELPEGARLWTTHVDGEPVKPATIAGKERQVRIPLVRTQVGDSDYPVQVVYAGSLGSLASLSTVTFPFVRTININVEQTQVALHLPEDVRWLNFRGALQTDKDGIRLGKQIYFEKKITSNNQKLMKGTRFEQERAAAALEELEQQIQLSVDSAPSKGKFAEQQKRNQRLVDEAQQTAEEQSYAVLGEQVERDNRAALNDLFSTQNYNRATNIVTNSGANFDGSAIAGGKSESKPSNRQFNKEWFDNNSLGPKSGESKGDKGDGKPGKKNMEERSGKQAQRRGEASGSFGNIARQIDKINQSQQPGQNDNTEMGQTRGGYALPAQLADPFAEGRGQGRAMPQPNQPGRPTSDSDEEFRRKLESRAFQTTVPRSPERGPGGGDGQFGRDRQIAQGVADSDQLVALLEAPEQMDGGLASVDLEIPERGTTYYFQATRGEVELTAQPVRDSSTKGLATVIASLIGLAVVWFATRRKDAA